MEAQVARLEYLGCIKDIHDILDHFIVLVFLTCDFNVPKLSEVKVPLLL